MHQKLAACCSSIASCLPPLLRKEIRDLMVIAWPVISTNVLNFTILSESLIICGHLTQVELDGAALANSIINGLGLSFGNGLVTACDTLFSQCYGSQFKSRVGLYLQQSIMIIGLFPFLVWPLYFNILPILLALGQIENVSRLAADYMLYFSPGLIFHYLYLILARYMQNQDKLMIPLAAALMGNAFNVVSQYLCIYVWQLGFIYSAICQAATYMVMSMSLLAYILISKVYAETWDGWKAESLMNWWQFLRLALPGMGMVSLEVLCWEIGTFIAGFIGPAELGAQSILFQTETCTFMLATGIAVAVNIRVGQHLGANDPQGAKRAWHAGVCCMMLAATVVCVVFVLGRDIIPRIFTNDEAVLAITAPIFPLLGLFLYLDGLAGVCAGALRGCGRQLTGVVFVFIAYYVLGLSIGIPLALAADLKVVGLWIGLVIGICIICPAYVVTLSRQNWQLQAEFANRRVEAAAVKQSFFDSSVTDLLQHEQQERQPLLAQSELSNDAQPSSHRRLPSNPMYTSASRPVAVQAPRHLQLRAGRLRKAICLRAACALVVFAIFIAGILVRIYVSHNQFISNSTSI